MERNFNHKKIFKIVWDIAYIVAFVTLMTHAISIAKDNVGYPKARDISKTIELESSQENFYGNEDCMNCDEID